MLTILIAKALKADGLYISAFNKKLNSNYLKNNYKIISSAHNIKEIRLKKLQGCSEIILSRLKQITKTRQIFWGLLNLIYLKN